MAVSSKYFSGSEKAHAEHEEEHDPRESLMFDPLPRVVWNWQGP